MKQYLLICICLSGFYSIKAQNHADSLFASEDYLNAAVEYERLAFEEKKDIASLLLKKAYCYKAIGDYREAFRTVDRISSVQNDSLNEIVSYEKVILAALSEEWAKAEYGLLMWDLKIKKENTALEQVRFLSLISLGKINEAKTHLRQNFSKLGINSVEANQFFRKKWKLKNPEKAYNLSLILPGLGQMYAGKFWKGAFSGTVQLGIIGFTGYHLYHGYFFTGGMTGAALFYTFYLGGARYARQLAEQYNEQLKSTIKQKFLAIPKK